MKKEAHQIALRTSQPGPQILSEQRGQALKGVVGQPNVPGAIDRERWEWLVIGQHQADCRHHLHHQRIVERPGRKHRREAGCGKPVIAIPQRDRQGLTQLQDHGAARLGATRFQEADVALRDPGFQAQLELGHATLLSPALQ